MRWLWRQKDRQIIQVFNAWYNSPRFAPSSESMERVRQRVMAHVYATQSKQAEPVPFYTRANILIRLFIPQNVWRFALQPALVMVLVLGVGTGGWITSVHAASNSLPGDMLYSIKIASERTQVALASLSQDERAVTGLRVAFAKRRLEEVKQVVKKPDGKRRAANAATAVRGFKKELSNINDSLKNAKTGKEGTDVDVAKSVQARSMEFATAISEARKEVETAEPLIAHELKSAERLAEQTNYTALSLLIVKHAAGDPLVREKDITAAVGDQLEKARKDVRAYVEQDGGDSDAQRKVAQVVREAEQMIEKRAFDGAMERVRAIQEIANATEPTQWAPQAGTTGEASIADVIVKVLKNVTSTIIGEPQK